ncbi:serine hydrolase domain-containing protein [Desulfosoma caldarium]|uniref:CubicO group peptidase (Beta-lactamase class C family) n=1 Tax=Desulfosoma caldarium TaxID=610254 RepID=A0A3N1VT79_9BACT|nr:serine hydrolase domain-containing protein [Desulfosoma caldarium]ROR03037.1 CubicO group peptidase (beta-lactamase class C family) [Desulfosoma caldarium]
MKPLEQRLVDLMQRALAERVFSAASVLVGHRDTVVFSRCYGTTFFGQKAPLVTPSSLFDLASLTKPIATASLVMALVKEGRILLEDSLEHIFPFRFVPRDKRTLTVEQLLCHTSGLPAYKPYFRELIAVRPERRKDTLMEWILREPLVSRPGTQRLYTDLGYMLLGWIVEEVSESPLDILFDQRLRSHETSWRLGYRRLMAFSATDHLPEASTRDTEPHDVCVATEHCPWRGRLLQGEVHDENAYCLNGVAGHAGLFGTAWDIWQWSQKLKDLFEPQWRLGFDVPNAHGSSAGRYFSPQTIGHLGFTGTSFWIDLDQHITVILLTNRVHPDRHDDRIRSFRPLFHDTVMESVLGVEGASSWFYEGGFA